MNPQTTIAPAAKNVRTLGQVALISTDVSRSFEGIIPALETHEAKVKVQFNVIAESANAVFVAGSFNKWHPEKTPLKKSANGWKASVTLPRGRYEYRFVVDGVWMSDPNASEAVANPFGGLNSVLSV